MTPNQGIGLTAILDMAHVTWANPTIMGLDTGLDKDFDKLNSVTSGSDTGKFKTSDSSKDSGKVELKT